MTTNDEMRERAQRLADDIAEYFCGVANDEDRVGVCRDILAFAEAEVSRAVRECIEAQCVACSDGIEVVDLTHVGGNRWEHVHADGEATLCESRVLRELLYQRELASKGEES